jgi:hypothetical protein
MRRQKARQQVEIGREFHRRSASSIATLSPEVLDKLAKDDPATFPQLVVKLMPKDYDINVTHKT